jgi:hypothetical protein
MCWGPLWLSLPSPSRIGPHDAFRWVEGLAPKSCLPFWYPLNWAVDELRIYDRELGSASDPPKAFENFVAPDYTSEPESFFIQPARIADVPRRRKRFAS